MALNHSISDMLTRIRNAALAGHRTVSFPDSRLKREICRILVEKKFVKKFVVTERGQKRTVKVLLKYFKGESVIQGVEGVSSPGLRIYLAAKKLPRVISGLGVAIVSTSKGLMTDAEARTANVGGEVLCKVW